ncbi:MAG: hypothetical protein JXQ73_15050 [Phycisphaerae bacterium]|nr:hypothetical protein [Phycisphaerae bacterium]
MYETTFVSGRTVHRLAAVTYWASLGLLLAGMWVLISPFDRTCGETGHVYVTVVGFELYIWLLLLLGRWQVRHALAADAARSGLFALFLTGMVFMALNELHAADAPWATGVSIIAVGLAAARLVMAQRWLGVRMPAFAGVLCVGWLVVLAAPAPILEHLSSTRTTQHGAGYVMCWVAALFVAAHLVLVAWQSRRGFANWGRPLGQWWASWLVVGMLSVLGVCQLLAVMRAEFVGFTAWYVTPIALAYGVVAVALSSACGRGYHAAWAMMGTAVMYSVVAAGSSAPADLPANWLHGPLSRPRYPLYASWAFASAMLAVTGVLLWRAWFVVLSLAAPAVAGMMESTSAVVRWRGGKGFTMLLGAFALLGLGAALQWWQQRRGGSAGVFVPATESDSNIKGSKLDKDDASGPPSGPPPNPEPSGQA